jgi:hypothetical protein
VSFIASDTIQHQVHEHLPKLPGMNGSDLNGLCEFVRNGGNQFSHRADPGRVGKIRLRLFGMFAVFNVRCRATPFRNRSALVPHWHGAYQDPAIDSV